MFDWSTVNSDEKINKEWESDFLFFLFEIIHRK